MQEEFEKLLGEKVTEKDYRLMEVVSQYHPAHLDMKAIALIYKEFGMSLIRDMVPRADRMKELEIRKQKASHEIFVVEKLMDAVASGCDLKELDERRGNKIGET